MAERFEEIGQLLADPEVITNQHRFRDLSKEYARLNPIVKDIETFRMLEEDIQAVLQWSQTTFESSAG